MLSFPPHTSHTLQPLDRSVYGPFKKYYNSACDGWILGHPGRTMKIYDIPGMVGTAFPRAMTPANILSGFRVSGISPFDKCIFNDDDFLPSAVTEMPNPCQPQTAVATVHQQPPTTTVATVHQQPPTTTVAMVHQQPPTTTVAMVHQQPPTTTVAMVHQQPPLRRCINNQKTVLPPQSYRLSMQLWMRRSPSHQRHTLFLLSKSDHFRKPALGKGSVTAENLDAQGC